ncbi:unnamed protein product, partial [Musa textilis]
EGKEELSLLCFITYSADHKNKKVQVIYFVSSASLLVKVGQDFMARHTPKFI